MPNITKLLGMLPDIDLCRREHSFVRTRYWSYMKVVRFQERKQKQTSPHPKIKAPKKKVAQYFFFFQQKKKVNIYEDDMNLPATQRMYIDMATQPSAPAGAFAEYEKATLIPSIPLHRHCNPNSKKKVIIMPRIHFLEFSLFLSRRDARIKHFSVPNKTVFGNACRLKTASSASLLFPHIGISAKFCSQAGYPVSLQKWRSMALHLPAFTHTHTHAWTTRTVNNGARLVSGHAIQQLLCVCVWVEERER